MATSSEAAYALTQTYRSQQNTQAAKIALLVALYYRQRVNVEDPAAVARWLDLMIPRILAGSNQLSGLAAAYASTLRRLEIPKETPITFSPSPGSLEEQIRTSLAVVGPADYMNKIREIRQTELPELQQQALIAEAKQVTADKVAATTVRHVASGGRQTLLDVTKQDGVALGYVRVTKDKPCFFCAMLASRGLVFADDSFADSDPRFVGEGTAKVHDNCTCSMKPVYVRKGDKALEASESYTELWSRWGAGGGGRTGAALRFRRGYDHWLATGELLDWDVVNSDEAFRARNKAA